MRHLQNGSSLAPRNVAAESGVESIVLSVQEFRRMISLERKRSERSRKPFLLMLLQIEENRGLANAASANRDSTNYDSTNNDSTNHDSGSDKKLAGEILYLLSRCIRETDAAGWYEEPLTVGVMFTELGFADYTVGLKALIARVSEKLRSALTCEDFDRLSLSIHVFPEEWEQNDEQRPSNPRLYPDLAEREKAQKTGRIIKRVIDIVGSLAAIVFLAPVFMIIAIAVKTTSKGSVFFRQHRIGQYGIPFSLLKFRSMYSGNDSSTHKEYVRQLIAGVAEKHASNGDTPGVYKLTRDARITAVGALLRRTSLDELPQFFNVLKGEMSLVGPRPPVDYEVERYELWHRRRLMDAKPGITGLWQVSGRNRIAFDDMVRLDLRYAQFWSPWFDLKILLRTPKAVIQGAH